MYILNILIDIHLNNYKYSTKHITDKGCDLMMYHEKVLMVSGITIISVVLEKIYMLLFPYYATVEQRNDLHSILGFIDYWCTIFLVIAIVSIIAILVITSPMIQKRIEKSQ